MELVIGNLYKLTLKSDGKVQVVLPYAKFVGPDASSGKTVYTFMQNGLGYGVTEAGIESIESLSEQQ